MTAADVDTEYIIRVNQYGALGTDCANVGDEFNPLIEIIDGVVTPNQDLTRGVIPTVTSDTNGDITLDEVQFLQNLGGKNALFGKSLSLYLASELDDAFVGTPLPKACCIIAQDAIAAVAPAPAPAPKPKYTNYYGSGYHDVFSNSYFNNYNYGYGGRSNQYYGGHW